MKRNWGDWIAAHGWTPAQLAEARRLWESDAKTGEILALLGLTLHRDLYRLARAAGWPWRDGRYVVRDRRRRPYTAAQLAEGRDLWDQGAPRWRIAKALGFPDTLSGEKAVDRTALAEGWGGRDVDRTRLIRWQRGRPDPQLSPVVLAQHLAAIPSVQRYDAQAMREIEPVRHQNRSARKRERALVKPRATLAQHCPVCTYRVEPGPYGVLVEGELLHLGCAERVGAA